MVYKFLLQASLCSFIFDDCARLLNIFTNDQAKIIKSRSLCLMIVINRIYIYIFVNRKKYGYRSDN